MATTVDQGNDITVVKPTNGGVGEPNGGDVAWRAVSTPASVAKKGNNYIKSNIAT